MAVSDPITRFQQVSDWRDGDALLGVPAIAGVFLVEFADGAPYFGRTANLRKRLRRLLRPQEGPAARLSLREIARNVRYCTTGSRFEADLLLYRMARVYRPGDYRRYLKLRPPAFIKVLLQNRFPRTCLTHRLTRSAAVFFGPFATRKAAEQFQKAFLDLFLVRRCVENLQPSPSHPGCIWGEIDLCLRPCQAACDSEQYSAEVSRMTRFLSSDGGSYLDEMEAARDAASAAMEFEAAARYHRLLAKARDALRLRDGLSHELSAQNGMVLQRSSAERCIEVVPLYKGSLQSGTRLGWGSGEPTGSFFAPRFREILENVRWSEAGPAEREDHLALLQRWYASSFRRGEFVRCPDVAAPPIRRLANAARRVALAE